MGQKKGLPALSAFSPERHCFVFYKDHASAARMMLAWKERTMTRENSNPGGPAAAEVRAGVRVFPGGDNAALMPRHCRTRVDDNVNMPYIQCRLH